MVDIRTIVAFYQVNFGFYDDAIRMRTHSDYGYWLSGQISMQHDTTVGEQTGNDDNLFERSVAAGNASKPVFGGRPAKWRVGLASNL